MPPIPVIRSVATAVGPHRYEQQELFELAGYTDDLARRFFRNSGIEQRAFTHPVEPLTRGKATRDELHRRFVEGAQGLAEAAARKALARAGLAPESIDLLVVATCTGYVCPSLASRLVGTLQFRRDLQRCDLVGLGCGAALPALQRAADLVCAHPERRALVITTEVCSACYFEDGSAETALANALFADGAAACVIESTENAERDAGPRLLDFRSQLDPEHIHYMGFHHVDGRLRIQIDRDIRTAGPRLVAEMVGKLLEPSGLARPDIACWVIHSGGRRVVEGIVKALELDERHAEAPREVLRRHGNMSSATVLFVLEQLQNDTPPQPGDYGVMLALGPGFAAEGALLRW